MRLADGPVLAETVKAELAREHISARAWKLAKRKLRIRSPKDGYQGRSRWSLPPDAAAQDQSGPYNQKRSSLREEGGEEEEIINNDTSQERFAKLERGKLERGQFGALKLEQKCQSGPTGTYSRERSSLVPIASSANGAGPKTLKCPKCGRASCSCTVTELRQFGRDQLPLLDGVDVAADVERFIAERDGRSSSPGRREREPGEDDVLPAPDPNDPYALPPTHSCLRCDSRDGWVRETDERGEKVWKCQCRARAA
jgi:hypothetical protein